VKGAARKRPRRRRALQKAQYSAADLADVLPATHERFPEVRDTQAPLGGYDPRLSRGERTHVHARGLLRDLTVRHDAHQRRVLLGVASLQVGRLRDLLPAQRAGVAFGLVMGRRGVEGALFVMLAFSSTAGLAFAVPPER